MKKVGQDEDGEDESGSIANMVEHLGTSEKLFNGTCYLFWVRSMQIVRLCHHVPIVFSRLLNDLELVYFNLTSLVYLRRNTKDTW